MHIRCMYANREKFLGDLNKALGKGTSLDDTLNRLEEVLLTSDIGATTTLQIIADLREISVGSENRLEPEDVNCVLRGTLVQVEVCQHEQLLCFCVIQTPYSDCVV
jgi:signal recognition particle GTPase